MFPVERGGEVVLESMGKGMTACQRRQGERSEEQRSI